jgi:hypothetical protein
MNQAPVRGSVAITEGIRIALDAVWAQKLRSFLTLSCVVIAILSIIAVVSVLDGMDRYVRDEVARAGTNVFTLERASELEIFTDFNAFLESLKSPRIRLADARALREEMGLAEYVDPGYRTRQNVFAGDRSVKDVEIQGRSEEYPGVDDLDLHLGRHLTSTDVQSNRASIVLGAKVAELLFPDVSPIGRQVKIRGRHYEVVGTFQERSNVLGNDRNSFAIIPITTLLQHFGARRSLRVYVKARELDSFPAAIDEARTIMRIRRGLRPGREGQLQHLDGGAARLVLGEALAGDLPLPDGHREHHPRRRGHHHHERDARFRDRAHARDRHPQGARSPEARDPLPVPRRGGHAHDRGRHRRDRPRHLRGDARRGLHAPALLGEPVVDRDRARDRLRRGRLLRPLSGQSRLAARPGRRAAP